MAKLLGHHWNNCAMANLNFVLLKVNGVDVSNCTQEEAVQVFLCAQEPITVEVKRRDSNVSQDTPGSPKRNVPVVVGGTGNNTASIGCQTDDIDLVANLLQADEDPVFDESPVSDLVNIFDECLVPDVDFEEITLQKSNSQEQLGLTVSYIHCAAGSGGSIGGGGNNSAGNNSVKSINEVDSEASTEVYISNIIPDSLAARDGRLRQGDQILQVNGRDVSDKEETESLFAENRKAVTLLISRYLSIDDYFENSDDMYSDNELWNDDSDEKRLLMESVNATSATTPPSAVPTKELLSPNRQAPLREMDNADKGTQKLTKLLYHNDPLHHTKVKAHLESVNNEIQMLDQRMEQLMMNKKNESAQEVYLDPVDSRPSIPRSNSMVERFSHAKMSHQVVDSETEHIYETIPEYSETEPIYCSPHDSHVDLIKMQQQNPPVMRWSKSFSAKDRSRTGAPSTASKAHRQRLSSGDDNNCDNKNQFSSSPFNTTDSGNSKKFLTLEFCASERAQCQGSTLVLCGPATASGKGAKQRGEMAIDRNGRREKDRKASNPKNVVRASEKCKVPNSLSNGHLQQQPDNDSGLKGVSVCNTLPVGASGDTMYTNAANLEQTITLQQELFRQSMLRQRMIRSNGVVGRTAKEAAGRRTRTNETENMNRKKVQEGSQVEKVDDVPQVVDAADEEQRMVWKVKRRPDGSRYIVRRPAQNRMLRSRELKINSQNYCGANELTTEDETMSEIKLGRYWNKDERKKHNEKAKERRNRQEQVLLENVKLMQRKNQVNVGGAQVNGEDTGNKAVILPSTLHGAGAKGIKAEPAVGGAGGSGECNDNTIMGLLSVTTV